MSIFIVCMSMSIGIPTSQSHAQSIVDDLYRNNNLSHVYDVYTIIQGLFRSYQGSIHTECQSQFNVCNFTEILDTIFVETGKYDQLDYEYIFELSIAYGSVDMIQQCLYALTNYRFRCHQLHYKHSLSALIIFAQWHHQSQDVIDYLQSIPFQTINHYLDIYNYVSEDIYAFTECQQYDLHTIDPLPEFSLVYSQIKV